MVVIGTNIFSTNTAICRLPVEPGPCQGQQYKRWYYDETKRTCIPFIYSGCAGNFNRFKNFDTCVKFCTVPLRDKEPPPLVEERPPGDRKIFFLSLHCLHESLEILIVNEVLIFWFVFS